MLKQALPEPLTTVFEVEQQGRVVLFSVESDVDLSGRARSTWLVVSEKELLVTGAPGSGHSDPPIPLGDIAEVRTMMAVGSGFLQARIDGVWVDVIRYSNRLSDRFGEAARKLAALVHDSSFEVEADDPSEPTHCPTCGLRLRFPGDHCPRCIPPQRIVHRVWRLLSPYRRAAALMMALALVAVIIELIPPLLQKFLVDRVLEPNQPGMSTNQLALLLLALVGGLAVVRLAAAGIGIGKGMISSRIGTSLTADLRSALVHKLHELSVSFYDRNQVGMLMSRVSYDTEAMHTLMHQATSGFLLQILQLFGIGAMLFWLNPKLAFFTLLPMPFVLGGSWFFTRYLYPRHHSYWESVGRQAAALTGMLSGIRVVKAFSQEGREYSRFEQSSLRLRDARQQVDSSTATFSSLVGFTFGLGALIVWYVGGRGVLTDEMSLGSLMAFLAYLAMFYTPLTTLTESTTWVSNFLTASQRIFSLLDTPSQVSEPKEPKRLENATGHVRFKNVSFSYDDQRNILDDVSFEIQPGEFVGIVGRSGSGKSTVVNLISRMYDATHGKVSIDGINVRDISKADLSRNIGVVLQEPFLFEGTIEQNIAYGRPGAPPEEILAAARSASAHEFILRTPFAYETMIGERGSGLSGGERQRLSIARALLYNPRLLILDEATSSVDTESERVIQEALQRFSRGRTTIAIAHRLSTLQHADRLLVFNMGKLVEQGTPRELLARNGIYAALVRIQSGIAAATALSANAPDENACEKTEKPLVESEGPQELCWLTPEKVGIHAGPRGVVCVHFDDCEFRNVIALRAFPSRFDEEYIAVLSQDDRGSTSELGLIRRLSEWPAEVQELLRNSLRRRYLLRRIDAIHSLRPDRGLLRCVAETESGPVDFSIHSDGSSMKSFGQNGCLMVDVDDNYYVLPDIDTLKAADRALLATYVRG